MLKQIIQSSALVTLIGLSACATIVEGSTDKVSVLTNPPVNANCNLVNERGNYFTQSQAPASVKKSRSDLKVTCNDAATGANGQSTLESEVEPWDFGNILLGGIIGLGVDWGTGAAYNYPDSVTVQMLVPQTYAPAAQSFVPGQYAPGTTAAPAYTPGYVPAPATTTTYYAPGTVATPGAAPYYPPAQTPTAPVVVPSPQPYYPAPASTVQP